MKITKAKIILALIIAWAVALIINSSFEVKTDNDEIFDNVVYVPDGKINAKNEGKLVLVSGKLNSYKPIKLIELDESINTFKLSRTVQDYNKYTLSNGNIEKRWEDRPISVTEEASHAVGNTDKDKEQKAKEPSLDDLYTNVFTSKVKLGNFQITDVLINKIETLSNYEQQSSIYGLEYNGEYYIDATHKDKPVIGDVRVSYHYFDLGKHPSITILAKQVGDSFESYELSSGSKVLEVYPDNIANEEDFSKVVARSERSHFFNRALVVLIILIAGTLLFKRDKDGAPKKQADNSKKSNTGHNSKSDATPLKTSEVQPLKQSKDK